MLLPANTFTERYFSTMRWCFPYTGIFSRAHTHTGTFTRMFLNAHALRRGSCTQKNFYTEMLWHRHGFTHTQALFTRTPTHTHTLLHRDDFTLSSSRTDTITNRGAFSKDWIYTRSFYIGMFLHMHTFGWFLTAGTHFALQVFCKQMWNRNFTAACGDWDAFHGNGWPSASPHCKFTSIIHAALPP